MKNELLGITARKINQEFHDFVLMLSQLPNDDGSIERWNIDVKELEDYYYEDRDTILKSKSRQILSLPTNFTINGVNYKIIDQKSKKPNKLVKFVSDNGFESENFEFYYEDKYQNSYILQQLMADIYPITQDFSDRFEVIHASIFRSFISEEESKKQYLEKRFFLDKKTGFYYEDEENNKNYRSDIRHRHFQNYDMYYLERLFRYYRQKKFNMPNINDIKFLKIYEKNDIYRIAKLNRIKNFEEQKQDFLQNNMYRNVYFGTADYSGFFYEDVTKKVINDFLENIIFSDNKQKGKEKSRKRQQKRGQIKSQKANFPDLIVAKSVFPTSKSIYTRIGFYFDKQKKAWLFAGKVRMGDYGYLYDNPFKAFNDKDIVLMNIRDNEPHKYDMIFKDENNFVFYNNLIEEDTMKRIKPVFSQIMKVFFGEKPLEKYELYIRDKIYYDFPLFEIQKNLNQTLQILTDIKKNIKSVWHQKS